MSCKLDVRSSNSHCFTGMNVDSTSIYLGKHWVQMENLGINCPGEKFSVVIYSTW